MTDYPLRPWPGDLEPETIEMGYYCEAHRVVKVKDALGRPVCPACIVAEALTLNANADRSGARLYYGTLREEGIDPDVAAHLVEEVYGTGVLDG